ncbi:MAG: holo-ACP synthase [Candidatus Hodarchaeota archaeon]
MVQWEIGIDIVEIQRFREKSYLDHEHFYKRVFNEYEIQYCLGYADPYPHFSGIFAAKEAVFKAVNKFIRINISQISIQHDRIGRPVIWPVRMSVMPKPLGNGWLNANRNLEVHVSITHSGDIALAWALVLSKSLEPDLIESMNDFLAEIQHVVNNEFKRQYFPSSRGIT